MRHWIGDRLHRQLFFAFAVSIIVSIAAVAGVFKLLGDGEHRWRRDERALAVLARRFGRDWDDAVERRALTRDLADAVGGGVRIDDARGHPVEAVAWPEDCHWSEHATISQGGRRLGVVQVCFDGAWPTVRPWVPFAALAAAIGVLWLMAGIAARRIARPLNELTRVTREIGEGKLASRARLRHNRRGEVGELTKAINDMAARIERQIKSQQELLAAVSHEMRTPLARVRLLVEIGRDKPERADVLDRIEDETVAMDELVGELLAAARLDFNASAPREIDVRDVATRAWERAAIAEGTLEFTGEPGQLRADATLLARALQAVLDNARKHGGGTVVLRVRGTPARVVFEVDDEGPGFSAGDEERIFEPFYGGRADMPAPDAPPGAAQTTNGRGTGLGLALVRRIAEAHGGRAWAARREPRGARISIELPRG